MVLEKDGEDELDQSSEKWRSNTKSPGEEKYPTNNKRRKATWIGYILSRNCHPKHVIGGEVEGMEEKRKGRNDGKTRKNT